MPLRLIKKYYSQIETQFSPKHNPRARFRAAGLACSAFFVAQLFVAETSYAADQSFVTIGTGGVTGVYYPSGAATCRIVNANRVEHGVRCSAESTLGSISNLNKIKSGELEFGFVQSDWQKHAYQGTSAFQANGPFKELRAVFSLHSEVATVVVRSGSDFHAFDDLKGHRVDVGGKGSGSAASWNALSEGLGWSDQDQTKLSDLKPSELAEALCSDKIDAYFVLIGHPARLIEETQEQCGIRLLGFEQASLAGLTKTMPSYMKIAIPGGLYGLSEPTNSFGVVASLVTSSKMPDRIVYTLVKAVHENFAALTQLHLALSNLKVDDLVKRDKAVPLHPGALKYFQEQGLVAATSPVQQD
ncbi:TRAP transporter solute receptor, TAXI family [Roseibium album]|nr:TRAP transporter solute receptor, TAXI family [Roseibium album]